ncbi:MAG TPA: NAD(P)/FAD-dependent oxidoreductase [Acidimicrobiia bacterium]
MSTAHEFDAVVVGAGPNGLVAAVTLALEGWRVLVLEAQDRPGGGTRSEELTLPGFVHDVCSAIHPLALSSKAFRNLPLEAHGLEWVHPDLPFAHPLDGGRAALVHRSLDETAVGLGADGAAYRRMIGPLVRQDLIDGLLEPLGFPRAPIPLARFGLAGIRSAAGLAGSRFETDEARGMFAGIAAHSMLSLRSSPTAGYGLMMAALAHLVGWPMARGGSASITRALIALLEANGGTLECDRPVRSLRDVPSARAVLLDLTPRQVVAIAGDRLPTRYRRALERFRYGPGVWKVDWALDGPAPWANPDVGRSATVHLGGTLAEITEAEDAVQRGRHPERPYVLFVQQTPFDPTRAPEGMHTAWAYCHVPNGSELDMTDRIEAQVERFAPGFRDRVVARHVMGPGSMARHDANYIGGDINGGLADLRQFVARPVASLVPWATPVGGLYLCSSSTPPGGGVHGICGMRAAQVAMRREG